MIEVEVNTKVKGYCLRNHLKYRVSTFHNKRINETYSRKCPNNKYSYYYWLVRSVASSWRVYRIYWEGWVVWVWIWVVLSVPSSSMTSSIRIIPILIVTMTIIIITIIILHIFYLLSKYIMPRENNSKIHLPKPIILISHMFRRYSKSNKC